MKNSSEIVITEYSGTFSRNKFLIRTLASWYESFVKYIQPFENRKILEIGAYAGIINKFYSSKAKAKLTILSQYDSNENEGNLSFKSNEFDAIFLLSSLYRTQNITRFFDEASRVLTNDGIIYITEPANTPFSRFIYKNFHHEPFNTKQNGWEIESTNPLFDSNQALCWIIFHRDKKQFNRLFPNLLVERRFLHTPFRYLLSGGYSMQPLLPSWCYPAVNFLEQLLYPFNRFIALFETVIIRKKSLNEK